jgi:hypothetical protein
MPTNWTRKRNARFRPLGSLAFDDRNLTWHVGQTIRLSWHTERQNQTSVCRWPAAVGAARTRQGESDLVFHDGNWFLTATCNVEEPDHPTLEISSALISALTNIASRFGRKAVQRLDREKRSPSASAAAHKTAKETDQVGPSPIAKTFGQRSSFCP